MAAVFTVCECSKESFGFNIKKKEFLKVRKEKQSGALQFFEVNKVSKDVRLWHLN